MNLRQAAQQALEALESGDWYIDQLEMLVYSADDTGTHEERAKVQAAITALRAALAEHDRLAGIEAIEKDAGIHVSQQAEPEQEPIGHADLGINNIYIFSESEPRVVPAGRTPLYTAPTPRKPLTDEEMRECAQAMNAEPLAEGWPELIKFARAIERAHGIGEHHGS